VLQVVGACGSEKKCMLEFVIASQQKKTCHCSWKAHNDKERRFLGLMVIGPEVNTSPQLEGACNDERSRKYIYRTVEKPLLQCLGVE
jgi:hypothetical protein